jgi:hypothetical protein
MVYLSDEPFVGSGDIQSLADLGNSFEHDTAGRTAENAVRRIVPGENGNIGGGNR